MYTNIAHLRDDGESYIDMLWSGLYYSDVMKRAYRVHCTLIGLFILFSAASCSRGGVESLKMEKLFSLSMGRIEEDLTFFYQKDMHNPYASIAMSNGIIFISTTQGHKVMKFNSYGDLIGLLYNSEENPKPTLLSTELEEGVISTRRAFEFPFREIGEIAVTDDLTLLVQDEIAEERQEFDADLDGMLDQVVLRFDKEGSFIDYLGQEGSGGTPFPYIVNVQVTSGGDPVVVCRTQTSWIIFWFNREGYLKYRLNLGPGALPPLGDDSAIPSVAAVFADRSDPRLYIKVDYYQNDSGEGSVTGAGIGYKGGYIKVFDLEQEQFVESLEIPVFYRSQHSSDLLSLEKEQMLYEFIGVSEGDVLFFLAPSEGTNYELMILSSDGRLLRRVNISLFDAETVFRNFNVSAEGIVTGLICSTQQADVVWWRTDKFVETDNE